jgi:hypothetical protein
LTDNFETVGSAKLMEITIMYNNREITWPVQVFCYRKVSALEQIKASLRRNNYKEVISLLEEFESDGEISKDMISFVHAQLGFLLLFDLRFKDAVNHFLLSETLQPSEIFPFIMRDPNRWLDLVCYTAHGDSKIAFEIIDFKSSEIKL